MSEEQQYDLYLQKEHVLLIPDALDWWCRIQKHQWFKAIQLHAPNGAELVWHRVLLGNELSEQTPRCLQEYAQFDWDEPRETQKRYAAEIENLLEHFVAQTKKQPVVRLSETQAHILKQATDSYCRLQMEQWFGISLTHILPVDDPRIGVFESIQTIIRSFPSRNYGITHPQLTNVAKLAYEVSAIVRKTLAWERARREKLVDDINAERDWKTMWTVDYDDPLKVTDTPLPVCKPTRNDAPPAGGTTTDTSPSN